MEDDMKKAVLALVAVLILSGCARMAFNYAPQRQTLDIPAPNTTATFSVGDRLLERGELVTERVLSVHAPVKGLCYSIPAGRYPMSGAASGRSFFHPEGKVKAHGPCDPVDGLSVADDRPGSLCVVSKYNTLYCYDADISVEDVQRHSDRKTYQALIFSGMAGGRAEFLYVERLGNEVLLSQPVSFDLTSLPLLTFRGARIQVLSYDRNSVTCTVLNGFDARRK